MWIEEVCKELAKKELSVIKVMKDMEMSGHKGGRPFLDLLCQLDETSRLVSDDQTYTLAESSTFFRRREPVVVAGKQGVGKTFQRALLAAEAAHKSKFDLARIHSRECFVMEARALTGSDQKYHDVNGNASVEHLLRAVPLEFGFSPVVLSSESLSWHPPSIGSQVLIDFGGCRFGRFAAILTDTGDTLGRRLNKSTVTDKEASHVLVWNNLLLPPEQTDEKWIEGCILMHPSFGIARSAYRSFDSIPGAVCLIQANCVLLGLIQRLLD